VFIRWFDLGSDGGILWVIFALLKNFLTSSSACFMSFRAFFTSSGLLTLAMVLVYILDCFLTRLDKARAEESESNVDNTGTGTKELEDPNSFPEPSGNTDSNDRDMPETVPTTEELRDTTDDANAEKVKDLEADEFFISLGPEYNSLTQCLRQKLVKILIKMMLNQPPM
jgi:hypothetical protein